jgi:hypothetical protein
MSDQPIRTWRLSPSGYPPDDLAITIQPDGEIDALPQIRDEDGRLEWWKAVEVIELEPMLDLLERAYNDALSLGLCQEIRNLLREHGRIK